MTKEPIFKIGPSILQSDLSLLGEECSRMMEAGADYLHLDVMDGHFVPNLTFGHPLVKCLRPKLKGVFLDMHMMVSDPDKWISPMADAGADQYTFHIEATSDPLNCIRKVKEAGMKVGIGVKPRTDVTLLEEFIPVVDMALIMTVEPGFGGQSFMLDMMKKVKYLRTTFPELEIEVDGGVNIETIKPCIEAGANMIVSGNAITSSPNPSQVIQKMRQIRTDCFQTRSATTSS